MPNIKAAVKWVRQTEKRTQRNLGVKTRLKTLYKKAAAGADAQTVQNVESEFDKAAQKGIIHPNKAARKKSRLAKAAKSATSTPVVAKSGVKKTSTRKKAAK